MYGPKPTGITWCVITQDDGKLTIGSSVLWSYILLFWKTFNSTIRHIKCTTLYNKDIISWMFGIEFCNLLMKWTVIPQWSHFNIFFERLWGPKQHFRLDYCNAWFIVIIVSSSSPSSFMNWSWVNHASPHHLPSSFWSPSLSCSVHDSMLGHHDSSLMT